jgi:predicted RNase H-like HicB family nuclease
MITLGKELNGEIERSKKGEEKMRRLILHGLIEKEKDRYTALCLELNVATEGKTLKEARANLREAIELYLEDVYAAGDEKKFIPRPAPRKEWLKFFKTEAELLSKELTKHALRPIKLEEVVHA